MKGKKPLFLHLKLAKAGGKNLKRESDNFPSANLETEGEVTNTCKLLVLACLPPNGNLKATLRKTKANFLLYFDSLFF